MTFEERAPAILGVDLVEDHEDGSATYTFHMDDYSSSKAAEIGIEFIITCAAYKLDIDDALKYLSTYNNGDTNDF